MRAGTKPRPVGSTVSGTGWGSSLRGSSSAAIWASSPVPSPTAAMVTFSRAASLAMRTPWPPRPRAGSSASGVALIRESLVTTTTKPSPRAGPAPATAVEARSLMPVVAAAPRPLTGTAAAGMRRAWASPATITTSAPSGAMKAAAT